MARTWARILPKMSDESAQWWANVRAKGKFAYICKRLLTEACALLLIWTLFWIFDWEVSIGILLFFFVLGVATSFRLWSDFEDQYSEYELARIVNDNPHSDQQ